MLIIEMVKEMHRSIDIDLMITSKVFTDIFLDTLNENDRLILTLRMQGKTYKEVADIAGYKNHSGVIKRITKIREMFIDFVDDDYHLETYLKPEYRDELRKKEVPEESSEETSE